MRAGARRHSSRFLSGKVSPPPHSPQLVQVLSHGVGRWGMGAWSGQPRKGGCLEGVNRCPVSSECELSSRCPRAARPRPRASVPVLTGAVLSVPPLDGAAPFL